MISDRIVTRLRIGNVPPHDYPAFGVTWQRVPGSMLSYEGRGEVWIDGSTRLYRRNPPAEGSPLTAAAAIQDDDDATWHASLSLTIPAYHLSLIVEPFKCGAWALFGDLPPDLSISTFWWASTLFLESIKSHPEWKLP